MKIVYGNPEEPKTSIAVSIPLAWKHILNTMNECPVPSPHALLGTLWPDYSLVCLIKRHTSTW